MPNTAVFQPVRSVIAKIHDTTVCTETATKMITTIMSPMAAPRLARCSTVPLHPIESVRYTQAFLLDTTPVSRSRQVARSGINGRNRYMTLPTKYVEIAKKSQRIGEGHR